MVFDNGLIGVLLGLLLAWLLFRFIFSKYFIPIEKFNQLDKEKTLLEEHHQLLKSRTHELDQLYKNQTIQASDNERKLIQAESQIQSLNDKLEFQATAQQKSSELIQQQFAKIAGDVLHKNVDQMTKINHDRLNLILNPLKEKINVFEKKVEETHEKQTVQSNLLKKEIVSLTALNQQMTLEANNLTKALKGDNKLQGNWGEIVLERVLERSGLIKGSEYYTQGQHMKLLNDFGQQLKPDVVLLLPDEKHIILDAKVSLVAYERFINAHEEEEQKSFLKQHINSIKGHVKNLSDKYYQSLNQVNSPDFVLLFLPIEASFGHAVSSDGDDLFGYAWERKVVIVSPSTLLATLKTIASIWKNEKQNKNALKIAEESGKLYDKFYAFVNDLEKVGKYIDSSHQVYEEAMKKLGTGKGNLLDRAEKLKKMGVNTKKTIDTPRSLREEQKQD